MSQTEFFECTCESDEHTLKFQLDVDEKELWTSVFLYQYRGFFCRLWVAVKYLFNYKCKDGHWDCFILKSEDASKLIGLLTRYQQLQNNLAPEALTGKPQVIRK